MRSPGPRPRRHLEGVVSGPRPGRMRDRRGRGTRGPVSLPGPLSPRGVPIHMSPRQRFDLLVGEIVRSLEKHFAAESDWVEVVVEEIPLLPDDWTDEVPTSAVVPAEGLTKVVLYRLPLTDRHADEVALEQAVWNVVLDRLAEVWQVSPDDLDPR